MPCLQAWSKSLEGVNYPLLSDFWPHGEVSKKYGVLTSEGHSERAIFLLDKEGVIRYIDIHDIDEQPDNEVVLNELRQLQGVDAGTGPVKRAAVESSPAVGGLIMYCTRWCPDCKRARAWLKEEGIEYTEVDINADKAAAEKVRLWAGGKLVTPTFESEGGVVVNFDKKKLEELIGR